MNTFGLLDFALWLSVVQILAFAVLPYIAWMCPHAPDRGYGLSKLLGIFVFSSLCWLSALAGLTSDNNLLVRLIFLVVVIAGFRGYRSGWFSTAELRALVSTHGRSVEGVFFGLTLLFGVIRVLNPEIFWGEKPMDSTFLNFFVRNETLPPQDPWAAGSLMSYYYLGIYIVAAVLKATGISGAIGFNVAMATVAGWIGCALYSLILLLTKNSRFAVMSSCLLVLASDPEALGLAVYNTIIGRDFTFDTVFWPSTRIAGSKWWIEYTSWSLLFADLHAHVVAIPFTITAVALGAIVFLDGSTRYSPRGFFLRCTLGVVVGALFGINTWDFISFGGVVGLFLLFARVPLFWRPPTNEDGSPNYGEIGLVTLFSRGVAFVWDATLVGLSALLVVWLYRQGVSFRPGGGWGWAAASEFNSFEWLARILGYWMAGIGAALAVLAWRRFRQGYAMSVPEWLAGIALVVLAFVPGFLSAAKGIQMHPWAMFAFGAVLISGAYLFLWSRAERPEPQVLALIAASVGGLVIVLEVFFLIDRMNTIFKGYMAVWILSGIAAVVGSYYAYQALGLLGATRAKRLARVTAYVFCALLLLGTSVNVFAIVRLKRVPTRYYTMDGIKYLEALNPDDAALISWFNKNVVGTPVVLEAHGDAYREYTRVSMHTGLPTILGWEHHSKQRGLSEEGVRLRKKAIQSIYTNEDIELTKKLLVDNRVDFIVIGGVERATYRRLNEAKFEAHPELFTKVGTFGGSILYVTYFSRYHQQFGSGNQSNVE